MLQTRSRFSRPKKGPGLICRNGPEGASHKLNLVPFSAFRSRYSLALALLLSTTAWHIGGGTSHAAEGWVDFREAGAFRCWADFPLDGLDGMFVHLNQLQADLVRTLGIRPAGEPIELYLLRDYWSYRKYLSRHLPQIPYRRALYIKKNGRGRVFAYRSRQFEIDVRHECTHALLHAALPMVPLWLDEGLAEYFEVAPQKRAFDNPHLKSLRWSLCLAVVPQLQKLEKKSDLSEMGRTEYRDAWAWVHFMIHGPTEAHRELVRFLIDIQGNTPPGLLSERLDRRLPDVRGAFTAHFKTWKR